jgi:hypothetical protein
MGVGVFEGGDGGVGIVNLSNNLNQLIASTIVPNAESEWTSCPCPRPRSCLRCCVCLHPPDTPATHRRAGHLACWPNHGPLESARRACTIPVDEREYRRPCRRTVVKERLSTRGMISHVEGWGAHSTPRALRCRSRVYAWIRCVPSPGRSTFTRACSRVRDFGARSGRIAVATRGEGARAAGYAAS